VPTLLPRFTIDQPETLNEASELLRGYGDEGCAYAGGTELLLAMKQGGLRFGHLVDLKTIPGLDAIQPVDGGLRIGALATHLDLERSPLLLERLPIVARMERRVANVRVRATGTLGGNLCFGEPHSDPATLLLCLDAQLHTTERDLHLNQFLIGPYQTALQSGELLESVTIPGLSPTQRASYQKFQLHEYPMLGLALVLDLDERADQVLHARVALGSVSPTPCRGTDAEALLVGATGDVRNRLNQAADALADDAELISDLEGSAEYKRHLIHVFLERAWAQALASTT
jgi:aerobic carbon-monoxide dehydrogenase medium subunit